MATCEKDVLVSPFLDDEMSQSERQEAEAHFAACETCREQLDAFQALRARLAVSAVPDPGFLARFRARRDALSPAPWWTWRQLALRLVPLALVVLVTAVLSVWLTLPQAPELRDFELEALGNPSIFEPESMSPDEPVLRIAIGPGPEEIP